MGRELIKCIEKRKETIVRSPSEKIKVKKKETKEKQFHSQWL